MFWKRLVSFAYLFLIFAICVFAIILVFPMLWKNYAFGQKQVLTLQKDFLSGKVDVYNSDGFPDLFKLERVQKNNFFVHYIRVHDDKGFSLSGGIEQKFKFFQRGKYSQYPWQKVVQTSLPGPLMSEKFTVDLIVNMVSPEILQIVLLRTMGVLIFILFLAIMYKFVEGAIIRKSRLNPASSAYGGIFLSRKEFVRRELARQQEVNQKSKTVVSDFSLDIPEKTVFVEDNEIPKDTQVKLDMDLLDSLDDRLSIEESDEIKGLTFHDKNQDVSSVDILDLDYLEGDNIQDTIQDLKDSVGTSKSKTLDSEDDTVNFSDITDLESEDKILDDFNDNSSDSKYELDSEDRFVDDKSDEDNSSLKKFPEPLLLKLPEQSSPLNISDAQSEQEKDAFQFSPVEFESIMNNSEILTLVGDELKEAEKEGEDFSLLVFSLKIQKGIREIRNFFMERKNLVVRDLSPHTYGVFLNKISLDQVYGIAGEFAYFMEKYANIVAIGISSRCDRHVQVNHLIKESLSALSEAINSGVCIIGFRPDIKVYNEIYGNVDE